MREKCAEIAVRERRGGIQIGREWGAPWYPLLIRDVEEREREGETMRRENPSRTDTSGRRIGWKERVRSITAKESNPQIPVRLSSGNILSLVPGQVGGWRGGA